MGYYDSRLKAQAFELRSVSAGYSNNAKLFTVLGSALEAVAGMSWEQFMSQRLLEPIGMNRTKVVGADYLADPNHATGYIKEKKELKGLQSVAPTWAAPAEGIYSNVADMAKWVLFNLQKGKVGDVRLVSTGGIIALQTVQAVVVDTFASVVETTGLGWFVQVVDGHRLSGIWGFSLPGYESAVQIWPQDNVGFVMLSNDANAGTYMSSIGSELQRRLILKK